LIDPEVRTPAGSWLPGPFVLLSLALGLGIAVAPQWSLPQPWEFILVAAMVGGLLGGLVLRQQFFPGAPPYFPPRSTILLLLPLFFLSGANLIQPRLAPPTTPDHLYNLLLTAEGAEENQDVVLAGVLRELPRQSPGGRTRLVLAVEELHRPAGSNAARGLIQLTVNGKITEDIRPGERLLVRTLAGPVRAFAVPGAFDYQLFLAYRGIWLSGWVASPLQLAKVREHDRDIADYVSSRISYLPERMRAGAGEILDRHLVDKPARPILRALIIGDRSEITPAELETFKAGGAMHLLAISGMHLGLIALLCMVAWEWLLKRSPHLLLAIHVRKAALLLALLPIIGYALITGLQPPAVRALIMTLVFIGAVLCNRQWCSLNNLGLAALIILVLDPPALFGASFQLSFAATAGIILLVPALQQRHHQTTGISPKMLFWILASLLVSAVATLVTAPLAMHHFHRVSLLSPVTTLLATPLIFFFSLPAGLIGLLAEVSGLPGGENLAGLLFTLAATGIDAAVFITTKLAALPFSFFYLVPPTPSEFFIWFLLFCAIAAGNYRMLHHARPKTADTRTDSKTAGPGSAHYLAENSRPRQAAARAVRAARIVTPLLVLLLLLLPVQRQWQRGDASSRISFIEVGHGNATVIEMPGNRTFLVDSGGPSTLSTHVGEQLIAPFLRHRGIKRLEAVVISHPHADHYNGLPFLLRHFRPQVLWINGREPEAREYRQVLQLAKELGIEVKVPAAGEILASRKLVANHGQTTTTIATKGRGAKIGEAAEIASDPRRIKLQNLVAFHLRETAESQPPLPDPENDQGLVIHYRHGDFSFLLPGDIGIDQERRLLSQVPRRYQVLAASHHGRRTSMAPEFVAGTTPHYIIVSDDQRKVEQRRIAEWQSTGATVFTTGRHGTVLCTTDGHLLECRPTRN
jgi:competence protein ComEC